MSLTHTFRVGSLTCHTLEGGSQKLDGGAMFGVVPKPLWEKKIPADERNRIPLGLRCLLVEHPDGLALIDAGVGNKESAKFVDIYGIENSGTPSQLEDAIREVGHAPADVGYVINTHLHFDHAGGNTYRNEGGEVVPAFPNAKYVVQRGELAFARRTNERTAGSYLAHNLDAIDAAGLWVLVDERAEVLPGLTVRPTPGHVPFHQSVLIESDGETACYLGDVMPTTAHVPLPWIMGYDLEPLVTLESKRSLVEQAEVDGWLLVFEHDPIVGLGRIELDGRRPVLQPIDTAAS